MTYRPNLITVR